MRGFLVFFTLVAVGAVLAAVAIGIYHFFRRKRDSLTPSRDSYDPRSSFNSGVTWTQARQFHRVPPPPPSYNATQSSYRSPATYAHKQTAPKAPAPPDYGRGVYHSSVASPQVRTPRQAQLPSTLTQPSSTRTQPSSTRTQPSPSHIQPYPTLTQPSSTRIQPYPTLTQPSSIRTQPSPTHIQPYPTLVQPSFVRTQPPPHVFSRETTESEPRLPTSPVVVSPGPRPDLPATVEDLDFAKKLREQARRNGREMSEARSRAKSAQKKGSLGAAQEHKRRANAHQSAMTELDKRAAEIIFREKNNNRKEGTIDLHGLHVAEAIRLAKDQVQAARSRGDDAVCFIVGKGLHADDGKAKIRPALEGIFTKQGLSHSLDPKNAGVLDVRLD